MSNPKFKQAANATDVIQDSVSAAIEKLNFAFNGRIVNGYGIYSRPEEQYYALREVHDLINKAVKAHLDTRWPTNSEYDAEDS